MNNNNYFDKKGQHLEQIMGESLTNLRTREIIRINLPDGSFRDFIPEDNVSVPDGKGGYIDGKIRNIYINEAGDSLGDNLSNVCLSSTGDLMLTSEYTAKCLSAFHPLNKSRNFLIGINGSNTENEAICNICRRRKAIFRFLLLLPIFGLILSFFVGFGQF